MYESFFGLKRKAFTLTSDPSLLFLNELSREALSGINYAILGRKGLMVLTGDAGTGKSTLLARVLRYLPAKVHVCSIMNPTLTVSEFLEMVLLHFGIAHIPESKPQRLQRLRELLIKNQEEGEISVLVVDEAHKLSAEILEEIRLLGNFESPEQKLLQVLLAGQPELSAVLNREDMRQLKQRIAVRLRIAPLPETEVGAYVACRWREAGGPEPLPFAPEAVALIARCSKGIPRLINCICDNALLLAFAETTHVTEEHVRSVAADLDLFVPPLPQSLIPAAAHPVRMHNVARPAAPPMPEPEAEPMAFPPVVIPPFRALSTFNEANGSHGAHGSTGSGSKSWWTRWTGRRWVVRSSER